MDKHYGFIYLTIDLKNGKGYVGQHKIHNQKTLDPDYIGSGTIIGNIKNKYGLKRFNRQILCFCESKEELNEKEIEYIAYFNAVESENFYNIAEGGYKNPLAGKTIEEMKIISNKISAKVNGEKNAMYGKNSEDYMTQEAIIEKRKNQSIAQKKRFEDKKEREKTSVGVKKHYEDPKEREKVSIANKKRFEDEKEREKLSKAQIKRFKDKKEREKQSIANKKRFEDPKEREKQSIANKKRYEDPKEREKTRLANKKRFEDPKEREKCGLPGEKNPRVKSVYCKELNIVFSYIGLAAEYCRNVLNSKIGTISIVCDGKRNFTGKLTDGTKLTWKWKEDVDQETLDKAEYIDSKKYEEILSQNVNVCK